MGEKIQGNTISEGCIRMHYHFYGRVQGVGFRYTAQWAAKSLGLTGWVRNEYDGTVTMEAQGSRMKIDKLLKKLNSSAYIRIEWMDSEELEPDPDERQFGVRC